MLTDTVLHYLYNGQQNIPNDINATKTDLYHSKQISNNLNNRHFLVTKNSAADYLQKFVESTTVLYFTVLYCQSANDQIESVDDDYIIPTTAAVVTFCVKIEVLQINLSLIILWKINLTYGLND